MSDFDPNQDSLARLSASLYPQISGLRQLRPPAALPVSTRNAFGLPGLEGASPLGRNSLMGLMPAEPVNYLKTIVSPAPRKRVFISFQAEDLWAVRRLRAISADTGIDFDFYDESVKKPFDSTDAAYIKRNLRERILRTSVTVCMVSPTTRYSKWVDWELMESLEKGNRIIGMGLPEGPSHLVLPRLFRQMGAPFYLWDLPFLKRQFENAEPPVSHRL